MLRYSFNEATQSFSRFTHKFFRLVIYLSLVGLLPVFWNVKGVQKNRPHLCDFCGNAVDSINLGFYTVCIGQVLT